MPTSANVVGRDRAGGGRQSGTRLAAIRQARDAKHARDARLRVRELEVEAALVDFYAASVAAEEIVARAQARAQQILVEAQAAVITPRRAVVDAVHRLRELGENRTSLQELTGLSAAQVRECLAADDVAGPGEVAAGGGPVAVASDGGRSEAVDHFGRPAPERALTDDPGPGPSPRSGSTARGPGRVEP